MPENNKNNTMKEFEELQNILGRRTVQKLSAEAQAEPVNQPEQAEAAAVPEKNEVSEQSKPKQNKDSGDGRKREEKKMANNEAPKKVRKITRAEAERRRKARKRKMMLRLGGMCLVFVLVIALAVFSIQKARSKKPGENSGAMGSMVVSGSAEAAADTNTNSGLSPNADLSLPASQQETLQYLKIKDSTDLPDYAYKYPGLYSDARSTDTVEATEKTCYLTFDDGPSESLTPQILDILSEYNVNATFFVVGSQVSGSEATLKRMIDEGNTICIHCNEHDYEKIYQTVDTFLDDFAAAYDAIYDATGFRVQGFRFPGGSNNGYITADESLYNAITEEMMRRGFEYYDWNSYDGDSESSVVPDPESLSTRAVDEVSMSPINDTILLMHDVWGKDNVVSALPAIIEGVQSEGFVIKPITNKTKSIHFYVNENTPAELCGAEVESEPAPVESGAMEEAPEEPIEY